MVHKDFGFAVTTCNVMSSVCQRWFSMLLPFLVTRTLKPPGEPGLCDTVPACVRSADSAEQGHG